LTITTATDYYHKALAGESESDLEDLTPPREVLDTDEQPSAAVIEGRKKWRKEILGAGNVQWKDTDLRKAVETCRIVERVICCDKAPKEKWKRTRSEDVAMEEALRKMGDETLDILRKLEATGKEADKIADMVFQFRLPRSKEPFRATNGGTSAVQKYLDIGERLTAKCRARATWKQYYKPWLRARDFLRTAILADGRDWAVETLVKFPAYLRAVAPWVYTTKSSAGAVETSMLALNLALRINDITVPDDFMVKTVREVSRRERLKAAHRRAAITVVEVRKILKLWGSKKQGPVRRMMACVVGMGFQCLLRWADMALIHINGIWWYKDGCVLVLPRRKNNQHKPELVAFADRGGDGSLFKLFKAHCELVAGRPMPIDGQCKGVARFVFRGIQKPRNGPQHTWNGKRIDQLEMESDRPIQRDTYHKYVHRFKWALETCCGLSKTAVKEFGMHSLRVGGDTWLFEANMPAEVRQRMGGWAHAFSEKTYIRTLVEERLSVCKAMGV